MFDFLCRYINWAITKNSPDFKYQCNWWNIIASLLARFREHKTMILSTLTFQMPQLVQNINSLTICIIPLAVLPTLLFHNPYQSSEGGGQSDVRKARRWFLAAPPVVPLFRLVYLVSNLFYGESARGVDI